jgi:hypothetical protein
MEGKSRIFCGSFENTGEYVYKVFVEFFNKRVEFFYAEIDPQQRMLFRLSELAELMNCDHSMVIKCFS